MIIVFKKHSLVFARKLFKLQSNRCEEHSLLLQEIFKLQIKCKLQSFQIVICTVPLAAQSTYKLPMPSVVYLPTPSISGTVDDQNGWLWSRVRRLSFRVPWLPRETAGPRRCRMSCLAAMVSASAGRRPCSPSNTCPRQWEPFTDAVGG